MMVGLNNSGKSTILCNLNLDMLEYARDMENIEQVSTCPTSGVSLVEFEKERVKWRVWELSGQGRFRNMWTYYSGHVQAIVYVVDVTDGDRIATARDELQALLDQPRVKEKRLPVLIFANKQDLGNGDDDANDGGKKALSIDNVRMAFGVESLQQKHKVKVLATSALTGTGVAEGFVWLNDVLYHQSKGEDLIDPSSSSAPACAPLLPFLTMSLQSVVHTTSHSLVPLLTTRFHLLLRGMIGSDQGDISASLSAGLGRTGSVVKTVLEQGSSWLMYIPLLQEEANDGNELGLRFLVHHLHITADVESGVVAFETASAATIASAPSGYRAALPVPAPSLVQAPYIRGNFVLSSAEFDSTCVTLSVQTPIGPLPMPSGLYLTNPPSSRRPSTQPLTSSSSFSSFAPLMFPANSTDSDSVHLDEAPANSTDNDTVDFDDTPFGTISPRETPPAHRLPFVAGTPNVNAPPPLLRWASWDDAQRSQDANTNSSATSSSRGFSLPRSRRPSSKSERGSQPALSPKKLLLPFLDTVRTLRELFFNPRMDIVRYQSFVESIPDAPPLSVTEESICEELGYLRKTTVWKKKKSVRVHRELNCALGRTECYSGEVEEWDKSGVYA
ncbi:hypothetical protein TeGR_g9776 [Tetraparma gracilis]|uniref:Uncharacterized protein n=1 Tax=Tetraparma gracilis TaxID=2962635 RepID=A0ABQ6N0Z7_9STRA|nr:hypothetical protein TeGR_g9776 [Tetraparma gracilis]